MRFASVYQGWETLEDFEAAIQVLKVERETDREEAIANAQAAAAENRAAVEEISDTQGD